jgi:2-phospho-L-lactate guanylyltransferase
VREPTWTVVVPVKRLAAAKTRLRGAWRDGTRAPLALAFAQDTVAAALRCPAVAGVLVVTNDAAAARALRGLGAGVEPDRPDAGLNAAVTHGVRVAGRSARPVAALAADLPALRPAELAEALAAAGREPGRAYVADAAGTGTTLLATGVDSALDPRFGPGSALAHAASGARRLDGDWPTLRRDVDTPADLAAVVGLGAGAHTRALLRVAYGAGMQGTVASYDPETRSGTLLLDDGAALEFPTAAFDASGLRLLRLGQRVHIERDGSGLVTRVTLVTMR